MCLKSITKAKQSLKDFSTYSDLESWYELHNYSLPVPNLCDDYSRETRMIAELDGYWVTPHLVHQGSCYGTIIFTDPNDPSKPDILAYHIANIAIVLNDETHNNQQSIYYIDINWRRLVFLCNLVFGGKY
jgi:hypothetical protein